MQNTVAADLERAGSPAVLLQDVHKSFGAVRALDGLNLELPESSTIALLGANGAGKSTAIGVMLGLLRPDSGTARTLGMTPRDAVAAGRVGAMLQTGALPTGARVRELVRFARELYPRPMATESIIAHAGLEPILERTVEAISGGETQRVRFAMAIAGDPDLVFLDEPTVGMDVESRRAFWETMHGFASAGRTILFATHYLDEADQAAERIVVVGAGKVLADGTPESLKAAAGGRVIRFVLPGADPERLTRLPGVIAVDQAGDRVTVRSNDSDASVRALLLAEPAAHDLEVAGSRLEDAFVALTGGAAAAARGQAVAAAQAMEVAA